MSESLPDAGSLAVVAPVAPDSGAPTAGTALGTLACAGKLASLGPDGEGTLSALGAEFGIDAAGIAERGGTTLDCVVAAVAGATGAGVL